jgi:hypothetical protein
LSTAKPMMKASTCSGSDRPPTDADEKGAPARVTGLVLAVAVESSKEVFTVHDVGPAPFRVSDVPVFQLRDVWVCVVCCMLYVGRLPVFSSLCSRADPHPVAPACLFTRGFRACCLPLDACRGLVVCGLDERGQLDWTQTEDVGSDSGPSALSCLHTLMMHDGPRPPSLGYRAYLFSANALGISELMAISESR